MAVCTAASTGSQLHTLQEINVTTSDSVLTVAMTAFALVVDEVVSRSVRGAEQEDERQLGAARHGH
jgi:hypothetical protein